MSDATDTITFTADGLNFDLTLTVAGTTGAGAVDAISGTVGGQTITGLSGFDGSDNQVAADTYPQFDGDGLSFTTQSAEYNLYADNNPSSSSNGQLLVSDGQASYTVQNYDFVACFLRSTMIATAQGEVAVETLRIGDLVRTASGASRPVKWIGWRDLDLARHPWPLEVYPVRVRAHAFGEDLPRRDLWLSPQHAVFVEGALIPVLRLANGATIAQQRAEKVSYWHVELDSHDVLLAEGLPAESFLDCGTRGGFANGGGIVELHPTFSPQGREASCAPVLESGPALEAARERLRARALALGFHPSDEPSLRVEAGGLTFWPTRDADGGYRFDLPAGLAELRLVSRSFRPADESGADVRHLGVAVSAMEIDGEALDLDRLGDGWNASEPGWRWSDGYGALPGGRVVVVRLSGGGRYWAAPETQIRPETTPVAISR